MSRADDGAAGSQQKHMTVGRAVRNTVTILIWYCISTTVILVTKWLFKNHFSFPLTVTTFSNTITTLWAFVFTRFGRFRPQPLTKRQFREYVLPIGISTALEIGCSNTALKILTVSFGTILKGGAPIFTMLWGIAFGVESFSVRLASCLITIAIGIALASFGEGHEFILLGFLLQVLATALGGLRWAMTHVLLQGNDENSMPPLTATLYTSPTTALCVLPVALALEGRHVRETMPELDPWEGWQIVGVMVLIATLVFLLLNCEYWLVNSTSSLALSVAGVFKELCTIAGGVVLFAETISTLNIVGFIVCQIGILAYIWIRYDAAMGAASSSTEQDLEELPLAFRDASETEEDDYSNTKDRLPEGDSIPRSDLRVEVAR